MAKPDPRLLSLGSEFYDAVEPARFPGCTARFLNRRWAERVGLESIRQGVDGAFLPDLSR